MANEEALHVTVAILLLFVVAGIGFVLAGDYFSLAKVFVFSFLIVCVHVFVKKGAAYLFDASVEHRIWHVFRFGYKAKQHFKKELPFGVFVPLIFSLISLGFFKVMTFLTYETRALKYRAAKRFGFYSYTEMTDWHNGLIGAAGIVSLLILSMISYFPDLELLSKMAAYYAFWNMVPISDLDGTQIFFGSRIIWTVLALTTLVFVFFALVL